jgi:nucleotide-binding universal stress UspA family protein
MRILVAIDDSNFSKAALQAVIARMRAKDAEVRVLHVVEPIAISVPAQMSAGFTPELEGQVKEARELVERAGQTLRAAGFKVKTAVEKGDARVKIIDCAAEWNADLIVVGSHGRKGLRRFLLGSVSEFVARHAHCSVEIVRTPSVN